MWGAGDRCTRVRPFWTAGAIAATGMSHAALLSCFPPWPRASAGLSENASIIAHGTLVALRGALMDHEGSWL